MPTLVVIQEHVTLCTSVVGFGVFMGVVDDKKNLESHQTCSSDYVKSEQEGNKSLRLIHEPSD